jgi:lysophospholipase L1-like esterase
VRRRDLRVLALAMASAAALGAVRPVAWAERVSPPPLPNSIAVIGDSISQAFDSSCCGDQPQHSWATGDSSTDTVTSHYERILAANPAIAGNNHNDAVSGARMSDAPGQASEAVAQGAEYVVILMGGNDLCTDSAATMTSVADFQAQYQATLETLQGLPAGAHIFVSSIPNVHQLWDLFKTNWRAQLVWSAAQICQSMLDPNNSEADRQLVVQREVAFNKILRSGCRLYANCRFDGNATYRYRFTSAAVSHIDYFHPSLLGQANLAETTWPLSWWPDT